MVNTSAGEKMVITIKRKHNKKAMIFTILAIVILSVFLLTFTVVSIGKDRKSINKRVETMNNYVFSLEKDMPRQLYISGFRIIFIFERKIIESGSPINDVENRFLELFFNGTYNGEYQEIMNGVTYTGIYDDLREKASYINLDINLTEPIVSIGQSDPWNIEIILTTNMIIKDKGNLALWNKTSVTKTKIPISHFEDPMYILNTRGLITNKINKTNYYPFVNGTDIENLSLHNQYSLYINSTDAPSFLDRLIGSYDSDPNGIESLVYLPQLSSQDIGVKSKSIVDHIYFSDENPSTNNIQGMPSWFKIDNDHLELYQVSGLVE